MKNDFLAELGYLGFIARLKRLSDVMLYSIRDVYQQRGFDIEPNWHLVFIYLKQNGASTMTDLAESFGLSQPAVVKIINKMKQKGYLEVASDEEDNRKRVLMLSQKAKDRLPVFESVWKGGESSIEDMLQGLNLYEEFKQFEDQVLLESFDKRINRNTNL